MALFSCVNDTIAICFVEQGYSQKREKEKKRLEMANERSDKEKEAHWDTR